MGWSRCENAQIWWKIMLLVNLFSAKLLSCKLALFLRFSCSPHSLLVLVSLSSCYLFALSSQPPCSLLVFSSVTTRSPISLALLFPSLASFFLSPRTLLNFTSVSSSSVSAPFSFSSRSPHALYPFSSCFHPGLLSLLPLQSLFTLFSFSSWSLLALYSFSPCSHPDLLPVSRRSLFALSSFS